jgi:hypothetical protein
VLFHKALEFLIIDQTRPIHVQVEKNPSSCLVWDIEGSEKRLNFVASDEAIFVSIHAFEALTWMLETFLKLLTHKVADFLQLSV